MGVSRLRLIAENLHLIGVRFSTPGWESFLSGLHRILPRPYRAPNLSCRRKVKPHLRFFPSSSHLPATMHTHGRGRLSQMNPQAEQEGAGHLRCRIVESHITCALTVWP